MPVSLPALTFSVFAFATRSGSHCCDAPTSTHRGRHAALARSTEAGTCEGVQGLFAVCIGQHHRVVLRAHHRLHALAVFTARRYTCVPTAVEPTNEIASPALRAQRVHDVLAAMHDIQHALRHTGLMASSTSCIVDSGSCSDGFSTNVLPQTIAIGNIHSGIIAGKLNGVMPAHTPIG